MGYAYVAITLDNRDHQLAIDYDEVTVARRIYRSGESEYLMNGSPVRLKDVNELFTIRVSARKATPSSARARLTKS